MYKRGTFDNLALHSEVVSGIEGRCEKVICECENDCAMKEKKEVRSKWLTIRLSETEEEKLTKLCRRTTAKALSEYAREVLLKEPVSVIYRNETADDFLAEMILLKKELNAIGNNFNQAVHKLHTLDHVSEIKTWAILNEAGKKSFYKKVEEIIEKLHQIHTLWLQK